MAVAWQPCMALMWPEGELLAEHWGVRDELGVLVQLGVLPAPEVRLPDVA